MRPAGLPEALGLRSTNAAHRTAVEWDTADGVRHGVYIARRDSDSLAAVALGGRLFPGTHRRARFATTDTADGVELHIRSADGEVAVDVAGRVGSELPAGSVFDSVDEASRFFADGKVGLSPGRDGALQALELEAFTWAVTPLAVEHVASSVLQRTYGDAAVFDNALLMRGIAHRWHERRVALAAGS